MDNHHHNHEEQPEIDSLLQSAMDRVMSDPRAAANYDARSDLRRANEIINNAGAKIRLNSMDVLCRPEPIGQSDDAVFLTRTAAGGGNSYLTLIRVTDREGGGYSANCTIFRPNFENSTLTSFITPSSELLSEITRQINIICTSTGPVFLGMTIREGYFKELKEAAEKMNELQPQPQANPVGVNESTGLPAAEVTCDLANINYPTLSEIINL